MKQMQTQLICITFPQKLSPEKSKSILSELRKRFTAQILVFSPKPPRGRKAILQIQDTVVIVTFIDQHQQQHQQHRQEQTPKQQQTQSSVQEGFTLAELIKNKK